MGETVRVKIVESDRMCSYGQLLEVLVPNTELGVDSLVQCKYFLRVRWLSIPGWTFFEDVLLRTDAS